jgi:hypothetical protein
MHLLRGLEPWYEPVAAMAPAMLPASSKQHAVSRPKFEMLEMNDKFAIKTLKNNT